VDGLPHWESDPDKWDIEKFSRDYIQSTYKTVLTKFGLSSMHVLGESQAAPGTVLLANTSPNKIRNLALIRPLGFSVDAYGATPEQRYKNFRRRIFLTQLQIWRRLLIEPRYLQISLLAYRAIRREPSQKAIKDKYTAGVSYDLTHHCRSAANKLHAQGGTLIILIGKDDKIFSAAEILATLRKGNIKYVSTVLLPGGHASLAVRSSKVVLQKALRIVRKGGPV
jgi:pimeloyl-ACP methyl ester carboxylesterase